MTACPVYHRRPLSACGSCHEPLNWFRPGLLECRCGATLVSGDSLLPSPQQCHLLDVIRRKVFGLNISEDHPLGPTAVPLYSMTLCALLAALRILGKHRLRVENIDNPDKPVCAAARVLADWPKRFHQLLRAIGESDSRPRGVRSIRSQFAAIYRDFFNPNIIPATESAFFKREFVHFAISHWGYGHLSKNLLEPLGVPRCKRFLSQLAVARHCGVRRSTAARILEAHNVPSREFMWGKHQRRLFDITGLTIPSNHDGRVLALGLAATLIGVPGNWLRHLKRRGYVSCHLAPKLGCCEWEIYYLQEHLLRLGPDVQQCSVPIADCISLDGKFMSTFVKAVKPSGAGHE
jgi:hypothetical protein